MSKTTKNNNRDLSQLRTLDDVMYHKKQLRREIRQQQAVIEAEWSQVKAAWSPVFTAKRSIGNVFSFLRPSTWSMFRIGMNIAAKLVRLFRKRA